ncbi:MAG TPA: hypothetical protein VLE69_02460 [Candidatus Saccharimonadales bacterium]|nr:hypothetical protein [Candidatus Saccharimonadales bacterium]
MLTAPEEAPPTPAERITATIAERQAEGYVLFALLDSNNPHDEFSGTDGSTYSIPTSFDDNLLDAYDFINLEIMAKKQNKYKAAYILGAGIESPTESEHNQQIDPFAGDLVYAPDSVAFMIRPKN